MDFLHFLGSESRNPINVFVDIDALDDIRNPMNLNLHYHEELVARTKEELDSYEAIMDKPYPQRVQDIREWYHGCTESLEKRAAEKGNAVSDLDFVSLCEKVKAAKSVKFFGGASLGFLQRLVIEDAVSNVQCYLQAVSEGILMQEQKLTVSRGGLRHFQILI